MKENLCYSIVYNLFFAVNKENKIIYGKSQDLLFYFNSLYGIKKDEYREITDERHIIHRLACTSDTEAWYRVICNENENVLNGVQVILELASKKDVEKLEGFLQEYDSEREEF